MWNYDPLPKTQPIHLEYVLKSTENEGLGHESVQDEHHGHLHQNEKTRTRTCFDYGSIAERAHIQEQDTRTQYDANYKRQSQLKWYDNLHQPYKMN